jgi:hypothetical protein
MLRREWQDRRLRWCAVRDLSGRDSDIVVGLCIIAGWLGQVELGVFCSYPYERQSVGFSGIGREEKV